MTTAPLSSNSITQPLSKNAKRKEKDKLKKIKKKEEEDSIQNNNNNQILDNTPIISTPQPTQQDITTTDTPHLQLDQTQIKSEQIETEKQQLSNSQSSPPESIHSTPEPTPVLVEELPTTTLPVPAVEPIEPTPSTDSSEEINALPPKEEPAPPSPVIAPEPTPILEPAPQEPIPSVPVIEEPPVVEVVPVPVILEQEQQDTPAIAKEAEAISTPTPVESEPSLATTVVEPVSAPEPTPEVTPTPIVTEPVIPKPASIKQQTPPVVSEKKPVTPVKSVAKSEKKKSKGIFASLFCCFGSAAASDDHPTPAPKPTQPEKASATENSSNVNEKVDTTTPVASTSTSDDKSGSTTPVETTSPPIIATTDSPLPPTTTIDPNDTTTAPPPSASAPESPFAAAVAPLPSSSHKRRRRSGKKALPVDQNIITSVPEPGMPQVRSTQEADDSEDGEDYESGDESEEEQDEEDEEMMLIARGGVGIPIGPDGTPQPLLKPIGPTSHLRGRKCLVLDLDETLVHSSFKMIQQADYVVPVEIENQYHNVYVIKRPGVDGFLKAMGEIYEIVIFTASLSKYADPVLDQLDIYKVVGDGARLFRESCYNNKGNYVKDLSQLGRPIAECIIIDNSPASYVFHPNNAVPISSWFNDPHDTELTDLIPFLTDLSKVDDVRGVLDAGLYLSLNPDVLELQDLVV